MKKIVSKLHRFLMSMAYPIIRILLRRNSGEE